MRENGEQPNSHTWVNPLRLKCLNKLTSCTINTTNLYWVLFEFVSLRLSAFFFFRLLQHAIGSFVFKREKVFCVAFAILYVNKCFECCICMGVCDCIGYVKGVTRYPLRVHFLYIDSDLKSQYMHTSVYTQRHTCIVATATTSIFHFFLNTLLAFFFFDYK